MARTNKIIAGLQKSDNTGFVFGAIALFFIGLAFLFVIFVNVGAGQETTRSFVDMLTVGFFGAFAFSLVIAARRKNKGEISSIFEPIGAVSISKQLNTVLPIGIMSGIIVVMINLSLNVSGNLLLGSAFGSVDPTNFALGLLAGVAEELFFRGFIQTMFEVFLGMTNFARFVAPIPTAMIFAWFHHFAYMGNDVAFIVMFGIGLGFGYIQALSRDIGTPILAHVINNSFSMFPILVTVIQGALIYVLIVVVVVVTVFMFSLGTRFRR